MTRVRGFTQDDAHLFCTPDQVADEFRGCLEMTKFVLETLGLTDYRVRLGFRDPKSTKHVGGDARWNAAEDSLKARPPGHEPAGSWLGNSLSLTRTFPSIIKACA